MSSTDEKSLLAAAEGTVGAPPKYSAAGYDNQPPAGHYQSVVVQQQPAAHVMAVGAVPQVSRGLHLHVLGHDLSSNWPS